MPSMDKQLLRPSMDKQVLCKFRGHIISIYVLMASGGLWLQPTSFELEEDTTGWPAYERGGLVTSVKEKKQLNFKTLEQGIAEPGEFLLSDFSKLERSALLHVGFQALDAFQVRQ